MKYWLAQLAALLMLGILVACGGHTAGLLPMSSNPGNAAEAVPAYSGSARLVKMTMRLIIAGPHKHRGGHGRSPKFVSPGTDGVFIEVYPHGKAHTSSNLIAKAAVDVSSGSAACGGHKGFPRTCNENIGVPATTTVGDDFVVATYDAAPVGGGFSSAHLLGTGTLSNQSVKVGKVNSLAVYIGGVIEGLSGNAAFVSVPGDWGPHALGIVIAPQDFGNHPITGGSNDPFSNPITVSVSETGGSGHATLSLNGGAGAVQVTVAHSSDSVQLQYDGYAGPGYGATVTLNAPAVGGKGGASETVQVGALTLSSASAGYQFPFANLKGNGDLLALNVGELNAPAGTLYTATSSSCAAVADITEVSGSPASASFEVFARGMIALPRPAGSGCQITVSDGTSAVNLTVVNQYVGVLGNLHNGTIQEFATATANSGPESITVGPDGAMWFTEESVSKIGTIAAEGQSQNPKAKDFVLSLAQTLTLDTIAVGPDGNLWWADWGSATSTVGKLTTAGVATTYSTQTRTTGPAGIVQGPDGAMWFTELCADQLGRILPDGTATYPPSAQVSLSAYPLGITLGSDGNLWFAENVANKIGKFNPVTGSLTEIPLTAGSRPVEITTGPDGNLWFTERGSNRIGRIPTTATAMNPQVTEYTGITGGYLYDITVGPDGALWFTELDPPSGTPYSQLGRIDPSSGVLSEIDTPTLNSEPWGISSGPDGAIWFTENHASQIGRVVLSSASLFRHAGNSGPMLRNSAKRGGP